MKQYAFRIKSKDETINGIMVLVEAYNEREARDKVMELMVSYVYDFKLEYVKRINYEQ